MGINHMDFVDFPFKTSKLKNDINYIYVKSGINVCLFVHQVIGVLLRVKTNALVDFHSTTSPQLMSFAECAKV
jgi:hypothetical protein